MINEILPCNLLGVYRFLATPRWIGLCLLMILAASAMVRLGMWQLDRYHDRSATNARIDAAGVTPPQPLASVLAGPGVTPNAGTGRVGPAPPGQAVWQRVEVTGRYDTVHEILVRARTVHSQVGFEVLTPLVLADGTAVLIDRGWIAPAPAGAAAVPSVPAAPAGPVTVVGRVHRSESRGGAPEPFAGRLSVRRISPSALAPQLPYPI